MLDFQAIRLLHRHGNGEYAGMVEKPERSATSADPERQWVKGTRIFGCVGCTDEIIVEPDIRSKGEAPHPSA